MINSSTGPSGSRGTCGKGTEGTLDEEFHRGNHPARGGIGTGAGFGLEADDRTGGRLMERFMSVLEGFRLGPGEEEGVA